jgi:hypothetical protein
MKKMKRIFFKRGLAVFAVCLVLFVTPFVLAKCTKGEQAQSPKEPELKAFTTSSLYKDFIGRNRHMGKVDVDAARIVRIDNTAAVVHIPVMKRTNVEGAIIGLPVDRKGHYELMYQDNRAALSGTGNIFLYTSANELFAKINLKDGIIKSVEPNPMNRMSTPQNSSARIDCGYWCKVKECYAHIKSIFPGQLACDLLDIFTGVCSLASVTTCIIKTARN